MVQSLVLCLGIGMGRAGSRCGKSILGAIPLPEQLGITTHKSECGHLTKTKLNIPQHKVSFATSQKVSIYLNTKIDLDSKDIGMERGNNLD